MNTSLPMLFKFLSSPFLQSNFHFLGRQFIFFFLSTFNMLFFGVVFHYNDIGMYFY